jgi:hypothetical protein
MGRHESGTAGAVGKNHFNASENSLVHNLKLKVLRRYLKSW